MSRHMSPFAFKLQMYRRQLVVQALRNCKGNVVHAGRELGIGRNHLYTLMNSLKLRVNDFRPPVLVMPSREKAI